MDIPLLDICVRKRRHYLHHVFPYLHKVTSATQDIMELILYTLAALLLYVISDYILNTIEIKLQKRLPNRSLVFFVIISILAVSSFSVIRMIYTGEDTDQTASNAQVMDKPVNAKHLQSQPAQKE